MDTHLAAIAQAVRHDIDRISTVNKVADGTGISYTTLTRRLTAGDFKVPELLAIAQFLRSDPADYFRAVEHCRSAAA